MLEDLPSFDGIRLQKFATLGLYEVHFKMFMILKAFVPNSMGKLKNNPHFKFFFQNLEYNEFPLEIDRFIEV